MTAVFSHAVTPQAVNPFNTTTPHDLPTLCSLLGCCACRMSSLLGVSDLAEHTMEEMCTFKLFIHLLTSLPPPYPEACYNEGPVYVSWYDLRFDEQADINVTVNMLYSMKTRMKTTWRCWFSLAMWRCFHQLFPWRQSVHFSITWLRFAVMHSSCAWHFSDLSENLSRTLEYGRLVDVTQRLIKPLVIIVSVCFMVD